MFMNRLYLAAVRRRSTDASSLGLLPVEKSQVSDLGRVLGFVCGKCSLLDLRSAVPAKIATECCSIA